MGIKTAPKIEPFADLRRRDERPGNQKRQQRKEKHRATRCSPRSITTRDALALHRASLLPPPLRLRFHTEFLVPRACSLLQFLSPSQLLASLARSLLLRQHQTGVDRDRDRGRGRKKCRDREGGDIAPRLVLLGKRFRR